MSSGSPRSRINQFYPSRKRKHPSPSLKSERNEKGAKITEEGSPSAKGTLDSFLKVSHNDNCSTKSVQNSSGSHVKQDSVRRSLTLEVPKSFVDETKAHLLSSQTYAETSKGTEANLKSLSQDPQKDVGAAGSRAKDSIASTYETLNFELKQFATSFLSLYCSGVQSLVSSPSRPKEDDQKCYGTTALSGLQTKPSIKRQSPANNFLSTKEIVCPREKKPVDLLSGLGGKTNEFASVSAEEIIVGNGDIAVPPSLRKCNNVSKSFACANECYTPGVSVMKTNAIETPTLTRGSSMFSPGDAFWNEAIQVADDLFVQSGNINSVEINQGKAPLEADNFCSGKHDKYIEKSNGNLADGESNARNTNFVDSSKVVEKCKKISEEEASPLPIKNLGHLFEDKNLTANAHSHCAIDDHNDSANKLREFSECGSATRKGIERVGVATKVWENDVVDGVQDKSYMGCGAHMIRTDSPLSEIRKPANSSGSDEVNTPSSVRLHKDSSDLSSWLPSEICNIYKKKGISKLYPWQVECLRVDGVLQRRNLVYCASTSAGKSFVAEILMLRRVITTGKMALLVLPYVSICAEKAEHLEVLLEPLGQQVRSYFGNQGGGTLPKDTSVAVCTIEKANSLINRLLEEGRLSELGIIVVDELHMVGDQHRGYLLELMLTKLRYAAGEGSSESSSGNSSGNSSGKTDTAQGLQIVGMSATMPNVGAVADWLQAALYQTDFRPVPLEEFIKVGNTIYDKKLEVVRTLSKTADLGGKDPDHIAELCNEIVQEGHSVLIFCSSRKGCESTAKHVSKFIKKFPVNVNGESNEFADISSAIDVLRRSPAGVDPILEETLPSGVAYHHAGLTVEEREVVETCYRKGLVRILTATSTLAAGVNLPARRVIFRQPMIGRDFIDGTRYKQMAGRAGRTGIDTKGESVLICKPGEVKRIMGLLNESCLPLHSCLSEDKNGMTHAILEVVAGGIVQTAKDIHRYVRCTLLNSTKPFQDVVKSAQDSLRWLCHRKFLEWNEDTKLYSTTTLGLASFGSSLCPEESLIVLDDLLRAREGFVLASDLHLVYLVTPINVDVEPNWELYYERFLELSALDQSVGNRVGVTEPFLMRMAHGAPLRTSNRSKHRNKDLQVGVDGGNCSTSNNTHSNEQTLRVSKRFYVALILSRLVQETPVLEVCETFKVARGMVQALQENAGRFASMVSVFCERLGWLDLEGLVAKFQNRVSFGVRAEIAELTSIPYVKGSRARALYKAGLRTPMSIAEASIPEIAKALFESSGWAAQENTAQTRLHLGVAKKIKNGARRIVLEKAEEARLAAFSAFKSLGLNIPQLSQPLPATAVRSLNGQETVAEDYSSGSKACIKKEQYPGVSSDLDLCNHHPDSHAEGTVVGSDTIHVASNSCNDIEASLSVQVGKAGNGDITHVRHVEQGLNTDNKLHSSEKNTASEKGPINAVSVIGGFDSFLDLWDSAREFYFDIHYNKRSGVNSVVPFEIHGLAICWENSPVYYINLLKDLLYSKDRKEVKPFIIASGGKDDAVGSHQLSEMIKVRWNRIREIMRKQNVRKFAWNLKIQIQVLKSPALSVQKYASLNLGKGSMDLNIIDGSYLLLKPVSVEHSIDLCIVAWLLWPDEERCSNPNIEKEVKKRLSPEAAAAATRSGRWRNQMRQVAHNGCCRRAAQVRGLCSVLWKILTSENLCEALVNIEMPLVNVLADMELWGIGVNLEGCLHARNVLGKKLQSLEKEAYKLAGMRFSLQTPADIANVLYGHLNLPKPESLSKGKLHPSTDKHCLDMLRNEHPIASVIKEYRTLAKLSNCTLGSICSLARLRLETQKYTLHGHWLQTSTATGRVSIEEPNLQCVEHEVEFTLNNDSDSERHSINARDFFVPTQENWLLLAADYSQIELRLMAHFSEDSSLIELLSKPEGDVFTMIAARWNHKPEDSIGSHERDQTKRLVYGILYGMGANRLAEQLNCSSDEAKEKMKSFKSSFPGVGSWVKDSVSHCQQKGYIETLKGRKRFLSKIKFGNVEEKSRAQRQAVNSICQGSAADIIKIAMTNIYSIIAKEVDMPGSSSLASKFHMLKGHCRILLQVHDELVLEVDPCFAKEAASLLRTSMETAVSLLVPLHVKLKVGKTWGSLEPFQADKDTITR